MTLFLDVIFNDVVLLLDFLKACGLRLDLKCQMLPRYIPLAPKPKLSLTASLETKAME